MDKDAVQYSAMMREINKFVESKKDETVKQVTDEIDAMLVASVGRDLTYVEVRDMLDSISTVIHHSLYALANTADEKFQKYLKVREQL